MNEAGAPVRQAVMDAIAAAEGLAAEGVEGVEGRRGGFLKEVQIAKYFRSSSRSDRRSIAPLCDSCRARHGRSMTAPQPPSKKSLPQASRDLVSRDK